MQAPKEMGAGAQGGSGVNLEERTKSVPPLTAVNDKYCWHSFLTPDTTLYTQDSAPCDCRRHCFASANLVQIARLSNLAAIEAATTPFACCCYNIQPLRPASIS